MKSVGAAMRQPGTWVFAYGSNMNLPDLRRWLQDRRFSVKGLLAATAATAPGYRLVWNYYSDARQGGAANVERTATGVLPGVALFLDDATLAAIDSKEGCPDIYSRGSKPVPVTLTEDGAMASAWLYIVQKRHTQPRHVAPTRHYLGLMIEGAQAFGLPVDHIESLRRTPTLD